MARLENLYRRILAPLFGQVETVSPNDSTSELNRIYKANKDLIKTSNERHGMAVLAMLAPAVYITLAKPEIEQVTGVLMNVAGIGLLYFAYNVIDRLFLVDAVYKQEKIAEKNGFLSLANSLEKNLANKK